MSRILFLIGDPIAAQELIRKKQGEFNRRGIEVKSLDEGKTDLLDALNIATASIQDAPDNKVAFLGLQAPHNAQTISDWSIKEILSLLKLEQARNLITRLFDSNVFLGSTKVSSNLAEAYQILATTTDEHSPINLSKTPLYDLGQISIAVNAPRTSSNVKNIKPVIFDIRDLDSSFGWFLDSAFRARVETDSKPDTPPVSTAKQISTNHETKAIDINLRDFLVINNAPALDSLSHLFKVERANPDISRIGGLARLSQQLLKDFNEVELSNSLPSGSHANLRSQFSCLDGFKLRLLVAGNEVVGAAIYTDYTTLTNDNLNRDSQTGTKTSKANTQSDKTSWFKRYLRGAINTMVKDLSQPIDLDSQVVVDAVYRKLHKTDFSNKVLGKLATEKNTYYLATGEDSEKLKDYQTMAEYRPTGSNPNDPPVLKLVSTQKAKK